MISDEDLNNEEIIDEVPPELEDGESQNNFQNQNNKQQQPSDVMQGG